MSDDVLGPGPRTRVRRLANKALYDEETIFAILDEGRLCHVANQESGDVLRRPGQIRFGELHQADCFRHARRHTRIHG